MSKTSLIAGSALALPNLPNLLIAKRIRGPIILDEGEHQQEVIDDWPVLTSKYTWLTTHNVTLDKDQNLYIMHEGDPKQKEHPSIFVFDPLEKFIRAFGSQF